MAVAKFLGMGMKTILSGTMLIFSMLVASGCVQQQYQTHKTSYDLYKEEQAQKQYAKKLLDDEYKIKEQALLQTVTDKDYGAIPKLNRAKIESEIKQSLIDPDSAKFYWDDAPKQYIMRDIKTNSPVPLWWVKVWVNAKNKFGGYTGKKCIQFYYKDGKRIWTSLYD